MRPFPFADIQTNAPNYPGPAEITHKGSKSITRRAPPTVKRPTSKAHTELHREDTNPMGKWLLFLYPRSRYRTQGRPPLPRPTSKVAILGLSLHRESLKKGMLESPPAFFFLFLPAVLGGGDSNVKMNQQIVDYFHFETGQPTSRYLLSRQGCSATYLS